MHVTYMPLLVLHLNQWKTTQLHRQALTNTPEKSNVSEIDPHLICHTLS